MMSYFLPARLRHWMGVLLCGIGLLILPGAVAAAQNCPLALVLALDASSSVDAQEYRLQRDGLARAFTDPDVQSAIVGGGGILVQVFEWSGSGQFVIHAGWTWLDTSLAIIGFASHLGQAQRGASDFPTALGYALGYAAIQLAKAPKPCTRQVIDVSGDGVNNHGFGPAIAYRVHNFDRVTVNGLVIKGAAPDPETYYRNEVIRGTGAFIELADDYADYARAMRRKLLREIGGAAIAGLPHIQQSLR